jgi:uncharacterized tellurite resistance protein B-like protein
MTSLESLYYAIGELAYAVARADGKIQEQEKEKIHQIVENALKNNEHNFDISEIVFQLMERDKVDSRTSYNWAMKQIRLNSHYLSPKLKKTIISVMEQVAEAYPPITGEERELIEDCKKEMEEIYGDPIFYE